MTSPVVEVSIFGKQYHLKASKDREKLEKIAEIADKKMREIADQVPDISTAGVAVLTCINLIDELLDYKEKTKKSISESEETLSEIIKEIDSRISIFRKKNY